MPNLRKDRIPKNPPETRVSTQGSEPIPVEEYERIKANYPNIVWNDEDQSFISRAGNKQYARILYYMRPLTDENRKAGGHARTVEANNAYDKYLKNLEMGLRISVAAKRVGLSYSRVKARRAADPDFAEREKAAEQVAAEPVEDALYAAAISGNVPAAIKWIEKRAPERWPGDKIQVEQKNTYELVAGDRVGNIQALLARLAERAELEPGYIDVEAIEPTE